MKFRLTLTCGHCGRSFGTNNRRRWCTPACRESAKNAQRRQSRQRSSMGNVNAGQRAEAAHDREVATWLHANIREWYLARHAERVAEGARPIVPLEVVLACHDAGEFATVSASELMRAVRVEDRPGPELELAWEDEE